MTEQLGMMVDELEVEIDADLQDYLPQCSDRTTFDLELAVKEAGGAIDPLTVWNGKLIDGHRRYEICKRLHLPLLGGIRTLDFATVREVKHWMDVYQTSRRNLNGHQWSMVIARMDKYLEEEKVAGRFTGNSLAEIGKSHNVSKSTVYRAKSHGEALEKLAEPIRSRILNGELKVSAEAVVEMAAMPQREQRAVVTAFVRGEHKSLTKAVLGDECEQKPIPESKLCKQSHGDTGCTNSKRVVLVTTDNAMKQLGILGKAIDELHESQPDGARAQGIRSMITNIRNSLIGWQKGSGAA